MCASEQERTAAAALLQLRVPRRFYSCMLQPLFSTGCVVYVYEGAFDEAATQRELPLPASFAASLRPAAIVLSMARVQRASACS